MIHGGTMRDLDDPSSSLDCRSGRPVCGRRARRREDDRSSAASDGHAPWYALALDLSRSASSMRKRKFLLLFCTLVAANSVAVAQRGPEIRRAARPVRGEYVVILRDSSDPESVGREAVGLFGGRLKHVYNDAVRGLAVRMSEQGALALAGDPRVAYVEENG